MRQTLTLFICIVAFAVFGVGMAGCGKGTEEPDTADVETLNIAWIPKALNNPVFEVGRDGAFQMAEELSALTGIDEDAPLPPFADRRFDRWFSKRARSGVGPRGRVIHRISMSMIAARSAISMPGAGRRRAASARHSARADCCSMSC